MSEIIYNMPNEEYHAHPALGSSGIKVLHHQTPAHYYARFLDPKRERKEPTPAMKIGTLWHCMVFEPAEFDSRYVVMPEGLDKRTKEGKALWAELVESGREPIALETFDRISAMAEAASQNKNYALLQSPPGHAEASIFWTDAETGVRCKIRPDYMSPPCRRFPNGLIVDGKTCEDASAEGFGKQVYNYDYQLQAAFYCEGYMQAFKTDACPEFLFMCQEKETPFAAAWYRATEELIAAGRAMYIPALELAAECQKSGYWPGYSDEVMPVILPPWALRTESEEVEIGFVG